MKTLNNLAEAYQAGRRAHAKGDFESACTAFRVAAALDPGNPIYPHAAAKAAQHVGRHDEAAKLFRRAITDAVEALDPSHPFLATVVHSLMKLSMEQVCRDERCKLHEFMGRNAGAARWVTHIR